MASQFPIIIYLFILNFNLAQSEWISFTLCLLAKLNLLLLSAQSMPHTHTLKMNPKNQLNVKLTIKQKNI